MVTISIHHPSTFYGLLISVKMCDQVRQKVKKLIVGSKDGEMMNNRRLTRTVKRSNIESKMKRLIEQARSSCNAGELFDHLLAMDKYIFEEKALFFPRVGSPPSDSVSYEAEVILDMVPMAAYAMAVQNLLDVVRNRSSSDDTVSAEHIGRYNAQRAQRGEFWTIVRDSAMASIPWQLDARMKYLEKVC
jgi:hypothetical protein